MNDKKTVLKGVFAVLVALLLVLCGFFSVLSLARLFEERRGEVRASAAVSSDLIFFSGDTIPAHVETQDDLLQYAKSVGVNTVMEYQGSSFVYVTGYWSRNGVTATTAEVYKVGYLLNDWSNLLVNNDPQNLYALRLETQAEGIDLYAEPVGSALPNDLSVNEDSSFYTGALVLFYDSSKAVYQPAFDEGYERGQRDGYDQGYQAGMVVGRDQGYSQGLEVAEKGDFFSLITAVVDAPIRAFTSLLDFHILGFNMKNFVLALLSAALVMSALRYFAKGG